jgi:anti-sigma B factor antagonist
MDSTNLMTFADALRAALQDEHQTLTLDLSGVTFCDSSGLRALLSAPGRRPVRLRGLSPALRRLLELTGTTERFEIVT